MVLPNSVLTSTRVSGLLSHFSWKAFALKLCSDALKRSEILLDWSSRLNRYFVGSSPSYFSRLDSCFGMTWLCYSFGGRCFFNSTSSWLTGSDSMDKSNKYSYQCHNMIYSYKQAERIRKNNRPPLRNKFL